jgi:hypothetical protein
MKQLGLSFLLLILILTSCGDKTVEISFAGIQSFEEAKNRREEFFTKISESDQAEDAKTENLNKLDSLYWEHVSGLLSAGRTVILDSETRASEQLQKILELKKEYLTYEYAGIKSQIAQQTISKLLNQIEADIVSLKHLQVWDNRLQTLDEELRKFGKIKFTGQFGENLLDEKIEVIDSTQSNDLGDVKQIVYKVKYTKIYEGTGNIFKYQVEGQGDWKVSLKTNQSILTIENLCPQCYTERRIN